MSLSLLARKVVAGGLLAAAPVLAFGQTYATNGVEYAIAGAQPGDQVHPQVSLSVKGGYLVWEDNVTDGYGLGVSAMKLDSSFSPVLSPFRVNQQGSGDQNRPHVSLLKDGGAAFVWQGGPQSYQHIYARFLSASNTWVGGDVQVNASNSWYQLAPAVATLTNGNVVVVWASLNQAATNSLQDVYGQILSPTGQKIGSEFLVNQFISYNQRHPAVAALSDGRFVVTWVSEQERTVNSLATTNSSTYGTASVDIFARLYTEAGAPAGNEFLVNTSSGLCSAPQVAGALDGTFLVVWNEKDRLNGTDGLEIWGRIFTPAGVGGTVVNINSTHQGDQFLPALSVDASGYFVTWTSLGQDGSKEGIFGQILNLDGTRNGGEFRVNTSWLNQQLHPAVAADGKGRFLAVWSSYTSGINSFDLFAQRYVNISQPLVPMNAPFVSAPFVLSNNVYQPQIRVAWPEETGLASAYEVYVNGEASPRVTLTTNIWLATGLAPNTTYSFQVDYVTPAGRRSPLSPAASATTWMGYSWYGSIPLEWVASYYGWDSSKWPAAGAPLVPGGPTLLQVFLGGGSPLDPSTWLVTKVVSTPEGPYLYWNPRPGYIYQVQTSSNLSTWGNVGSPRMAADSIDSLRMPGGNVGYYRVLQMR